MHLTYFQRRITEVLPENAAEYLLLPSTLFGPYDIDRILACDQILINMGQTELVLVFQKGGSHVAFEKTTEVARLQAGNICDLLNGDRFIIMLGCILKNWI